MSKIVYDNCLVFYTVLLSLESKSRVPVCVGKWWWCKVIFVSNSKTVIVDFGLKLGWGFDNKIGMLLGVLINYEIKILILIRASAWLNTWSSLPVRLLVLVSFWDFDFFKIWRSCGLFCQYASIQTKLWSLQKESRKDIILLLYYIIQYYFHEFFLPF